MNRNKSASVAILFALMFIVLLGFTALATEVGFVLFKQRQMQSAASAAALGGATALMTGHPAVSVEANAIATQAGFTSGTAAATVTVNSPPKAGNDINKAGYVEVIILQPQSLPLSGLFGITAWQIQARAVAAEGNSASDCVLQLDTASTLGVSITNGANVNMNSCGLGVNANGGTALTVQGATLTAASVSVAGTTTVNNGGAINISPVTNPAVQTSQPAVTDPYSGIAIPTYGGCDHGSLPSSPLVTTGTTTLSPGVYCGGLGMAYGSVTMNPGVYIINGGSFSPAGGVTLTGAGVTIVLTGSGTNYATVNIANGVNATLSAPTTGATSGLVFFQDRAAPNTGTDSIAGGASLQLTGAMYFPNQQMSYSNGTSTTVNCTQLVAWKIVFTGGASFNSSCASAGVSTIGAGPSQLVE